MIKVLIVDDSPLIRGLLKEILGQANGIEVVGTAEDPFQARELIKSTNPDVLTLDIEMPKMNGISFLKNLMRLRPMPVVMISTLTQEGSPATIEALELGAVDFISKPTSNVADTMMSYADILVKKVRVAATARVRTFRPPKQTEIPVADKLSFSRTTVFAIGASTGGTEAIREVLMKLPTHAPPVVITQHIPPVFSTSFALRMDRTCAVAVKEAEEGDVLKPGHVYIAPGGRHLSVKQKAGSYVCSLSDGEPVNRHKPSVEVLFNSLLPVAKHVCAVMLTGMGSDGAKAMLSLREAGAKTLAQDELTSVVWGMPKAAFELRATDTLIPLGRMTEAMINAVKK